MTEQLRFMKKIILLSLIAVGIIFAGQVVLADSAVLSVSPATATKNVGATFSTSVQLDPAGNKVCVVSGTLNFSNLTCQNITVVSGLMAQTAPTCDNPSFTLGIPKCATVAQNLFSVSVAGADVGQAGLSLTGVKVIGAGTIVASNLQGGAYNITAIVIKPKVTTPVSTTTTVTQPATQQVTTPTQQTTPTTTIPANAGTGALANTGASQWFNWILIIVVILIVIYAIYYFTTKRKKK